MPNHYNALGLHYDPNHTTSDFDRARRQAEANLPGKFPDPVIREAKRQEIMNAYNILKDPLRRQEYDAMLSEEEKAEGLRDSENAAYNNANALPLKQQIYHHARLNYEKTVDVNRGTSNSGSDLFEYVLIDTLILVRAPDFDVWAKQNGRAADIYRGENPSLNDRETFKVGSGPQQIQGWNDLLTEYQNDVSVVRNPDGTVQALNFANPERRDAFLNEARRRNLNDAPGPDPIERPRL